MKTGSAVLAGVAGVALLTLGVALNTDGAASEDTVRVAYFPNIGHAAPIVGMEKGFFARDLGDTRIETRVFDSGPQAIESLFAGSVDLAYVGPGPAINGHLNSENIQVLAGAASGGASFVVHPDSEILAPSDFAGKKIAAPQIGNTQDVSLRSYIAGHGLAPAERGGSVTIYNVANPDIYTLFAKGDVDGAWVAEPWATILEDLGGKRLFYEEQLWPDNRFASVLLIGNADYIERNPQTVADYVASHHSTISWINANRQEAGGVFNAFLESYLGQRLPDHIVNTALANIEITGDPLPDSVASFAQQADSLGYLGRHGYDLGGLYHDSNFTAGDAR